MITVRDLIHELESLDPEAEVRLMTQSSWPFDNAVTRVWTPYPVESLACAECSQDAEASIHEETEALGFHEFVEAEDAEDRTFVPKDDFSRVHDGPVVYLVEGEQNGYGTKEAWS